MKSWFRAALGVAFLLGAVQAEAQPLPAYPSIPYTLAQPQDFVQLNSPRFTYGTFLSLGDLANWSWKFPTVTTQYALIYSLGAGLGIGGVTPCAGLVYYPPGAAPGCTTAIPNGVTATTQALSDATTKLATDAFVQNQLAAPIALATGSTATTQAVTDSSTKVATTADVWAASPGINVLQQGASNNAAYIITGISGTSSPYTITASGVPALSPGTAVIISGVTPASLNGAYSVTSGSSGSFTATTSATGTWASGGIATQTSVATATTAAFNAAFTAVGSGGSIIVPCGTYSINGALSMTVASGAAVNINGQGRDCVKLDFTAGAGLTINLGSNLFTIANLSGMTFLTGTASPSTVALTLNGTGTGNLGLQPQKSIEDIACRGDDGYGATNYWGTCVNINGSPNQVNISGIHVVGNYTGGTGVSLTGTSSSFPEAINLTNSTFLALNIGVNYGNYVEGLQATANNFTAVNYCVRIPTGESGLTELVFQGNQCNPGPNGYGINFGSVVTAPIITGNDFILSTGAVGVFGLSVSGTIIGNTISCPGSSTGNGIALSSGGQINMITGNNIGPCSTGIWLQAGANNNNIQSNKYFSNTTDVLVDVAATGNHCGQTTTNCTAGSTN